MKILKKLGPTALFTYTTISAISFTSWMTAFYFGIDPQYILEKIDRLNSYFGFKSLSESPKSTPHLGAILGLSVIAHNFIFPVRLAITAVITPHAKRFLNSRKIDMHSFKTIRDSFKK